LIVVSRSLACWLIDCLMPLMPPNRELDECVGSALPLLLLVVWLVVVEVGGAGKLLVVTEVYWVLLFELLFELLQSILISTSSTSPSK
jgi:hypothetical protein